MRKMFRFQSNMSAISRNLSTVRNSVNDLSLEENGYFLLCRAIECGHRGTAMQLMKEGVNVNSVCKMPKNTPLHFAVMNGDKDIVTMLLIKGARVNARNKDGCTPLHYAVAKIRMYHITVLLLRHGAQVYAKNNRKETPLQLAFENRSIHIFSECLPFAIRGNVSGWPDPDDLHAAVAYGHTEFLTEDINMNLQDWTDRSLLYIAIEWNHTEIAKYLLARGASVHPVKTPRNGYTPLHVTCENGLYEIAQLLLRRGANVNATTQYQITPIHLATNSHHYELTRLLLNYKANVDTVDVEGNTILHNAVIKGDLPMVDIILSYCPNINNVSNKAAFRIVVSMWGEMYNGIIKSLLKYGFRIGPEHAGDSKLLRNAIEKGCPTIIEDLLNYGTKVDDNLDLLRIAVRNRWKTIIKLSLDRCFHVNAGDIDVDTALCYTTFPNQPPSKGDNDVNFCTRADMAELLLQKGPSINVMTVSSLTTLHLAILHQRGSHFARIILKHGGDVKKVIVMIDRSNRQQYTVDTPLHLAIHERCNPDIVRTLLKYGANVKSQNRNGETPLHFAAQEGTEEICRILLKAGADVHATSLWGSTPLHMAAEHGHVCIINILLNSGADVNSIDNCGNTPLHLASKAAEDVTVLTLTKNGSDINILNKRNEAAYHVAKNSNPKKFCRITTIQEHLIKLHVLNLYMNKRNFENFNTTARTNGGSQFVEKCKEEMERMKITIIINTTVTFYDILTKSIDQLVSYARNEDIVKVFSLGNLKENKRKFPEYADLIESRFAKGVAQKILLNEGHNVFFKIYDLPENCTERILSHLTDKDLKALKDI